MTFQRSGRTDSTNKVDNECLCECGENMWHMQTVREKTAFHSMAQTIFKFGTAKHTENEISNFSDCHASNNGQIAKWQSLQHRRLVVIAIVTVVDCI